MSPHSSFPQDDLDALLTPTPAPSSDTLQQAIFRQTRSMVRRRQYVRRLMQVAALVLCYAAGAATMRVWQPVPAASVAKVEQPSAPPAAPTAPTTPYKLVAKAPPAQPAAPPLSPYEKLRRYSDRILEEKGDIPLAARSYAQALRKATAEEQAISSGDTWLLMAIKHDRMQEKSDAPHGS